MPYRWFCLIVEKGRLLGLGVETPTKAFPSCFPPNFATEILPQGLPAMQIEVFRVCKTGIICKDTFLSSYEEVLLGLRPEPYRWERQKKKAITYSTSCNDTLEGAMNPLKCLTDYFPEAYLIHGTACSEYGPLQRTIEREPSYKDETHHDWWLYADSDPSPCFTRVEPPENSE